DSVGAARCAGCHAAEHAAWRGSHHDLAMAPAGPDTVLGDFGGREITVNGVTSRFFTRDGGYWVSTEGADGARGDYRVAYTFGWTPLQQYLIEFPGGRLQALGLAWDTRPEAEGGQRWFHLYPDAPPPPGDPLHWTGHEQTWNYQCAECHSTHLSKNYDAGSDSYRTTWSEIDVACETCHGPGAAHVEWAGQGAPAGADKGLAVDLADRDGGAWTVHDFTGKPTRSVARTSHTLTETCARCHSRRGQLWPSHRPGAPLADSHRLALLTADLYFADGQIRDEVYVHGSFLQSPMYRAGVTCNDCHDPHSLELRAEGNALCTRCHTAARYDDARHHHHTEKSAGAACTACHMPERTYMVIDRRADHSMRVPRPDLSASLGVPNACTGCHADRGDDWAAAAVAAWFPAGRSTGAHFGEVFHAARAGEAGADERLVALAADTGAPGIVRATAVEELGPAVRREHLFTIRRLLGDDDALVRAAALRHLEALDVPSRVDLVWPLLDDPVRSVRLEAARLVAPLARERLPPPYGPQLEAALDEYRAALRVNADRPEGQLGIGLLAQAEGDAQAANDAYRRALALDPGFVPAYVNLADLYRALGRDEQALAILREGIAVAPGSADLHHALGLALVRSDRKADAVASLAKAAELAPERARYAFAHALILNDLGHGEEARAVLEQANARHPGNGELLFALATLSRDLGDYPAARKYADELVRRFPDDPQAKALLQSLPAQ
ncbi:MAG: tetratricopeptide repeat protein, partial [Burkholderiales bacterium]|nr:tetratricopeptide repeat protein [Burkholderiales bacterium]